MFTPPPRAAAPAAVATIPVRLGERRYDVTLAPGLLARLGDRLRELLGAPGKVAVVTDRRVAALHAPTALAALRRSGFRPHLLIVPTGERAKTLAGAARLYDGLLALGAERGTPVVALGGGVVGDLAGFVAATFQRGLPFVQVPTTLLAQVDASVGGKVAVNHPQAKNLIGCFHQPAAVLIDPDTLATLPRRDLAAGLAEVVKCGVIRSRPLFDALERDAARLLARDPAALLPAIRGAVTIKARLVEADERDLGVRALLNYGHTVGHALETLAHYRGLRHGEAVALGMTAAARIAVEVGLLRAEDEARQTALLAALGLPTRQRRAAPAHILAALATDKKVRDGRVRFVLPHRIGAAELVDRVPVAAVRRGIARVCLPAH